MLSFDLTDKVALVVGGNGGIGLGIAQGLAAAGASLVIVARNPEKNRAALASLEGLGGKAVAVETDITVEKQARQAIDRALIDLGRIDILVNCAGINVRKLPQDYALDEWHSVMNVNLTAAFALCQLVHPHLCRVGGGKIINIGSMASIFGSPLSAPYAASKAAIVQLTKALATAWAQDNIQVNAILPGWIDTDLTRQTRKEVEGLYDRIVERTPAKRWGKPEDHAGLAVFLSSPASDFITGAAIPVDGGFSIQG